jgi:hypothetical protein
MQTILKKCLFKGTGKLSKLLRLIPRGHQQSTGVSHPANQISAGYYTPLNTFLQGIRLRGITFEFEYLHEFETEFENILGDESGGHVGLIHEKN